MLEYVQCFPTNPRTALRHSRERAETASRLACCAYLAQNLAMCARQFFGYRYRRMERYTQQTRILERRGRRWVAYGKLVEITVYVRYVKGRPSRHRHIETRIYVSMPLHRDCNQYVQQGWEDYWIEAAAEFLMARDQATTAAYVIQLSEEGDVKVGCREITKFDMNCDLPVWCNGVYRLPTDCLHPPKPIAVQVYDYRGYTWEAGELPCAGVG